MHCDAPIVAETHMEGMGWWVPGGEMKTDDVYLGVGEMGADHSFC